MQASASSPNIDRSVTAPISLPHHNISVQEMYKLSTRNNTAWGIEGYKVPAEYLDPRKLHEISANTVKKAAPRALKKPDYLTDIMRATRDKPGPNKYDIVKPWFDKDKQKQTPKHATKKNTYIDLIIHENKLRPTPGPGAHNVIKAVPPMTKKGGEIKPKGSERKDFLCEVQYLSNMVPGPGNYNPREIQPVIKENKMTPEDWKKKHAELNKRTKSANPDKDNHQKTMMPLPVSFNTFEKLYEISKDKNKSQTKVKVWGTSARFVSKKDVKKDPNNFPGPGTYGMTAEWNGKLPLASKDTKDKNWMNKVTKGIEKSIYYS